MRPVIFGNPMSERNLSGVFESGARPDACYINGVRPKTIYVDGVFDLFHPGHIAFLKKARAAGPSGSRLIVGVITDEDARWKRVPIMTHAERLIMVRHCTEMDDVVERPPLVLTEEFLDTHGIDLVVHGDDSRQEEFFQVPISRGQMVYVSYEKGISTSAIIKRVLSQADANGIDL